MTIIDAFANAAPNESDAALLKRTPEIFLIERLAEDALTKDQSVRPVALSLPEQARFIVKKPGDPGVPIFQVGDFMDACTIAVGSGNRIDYVHIVDTDKSGSEIALRLGSFIVKANA